MKLKDESEGDDEVKGEGNVKDEDKFKGSILWKRNPESSKKLSCPSL